MKKIGVLLSVIILAFAFLGCDSQLAEKFRNSMETEEAQTTVVEETTTQQLVTEDMLHEAFLRSATGEEAFFFYDDFDHDGTFEAYGITGDYSEPESLYDNVYIYFISNNQTVTCMNKEEALYGYLPDNELMEAGEHKYLVWEKSAGGSGSVSYIYGVKDGNEYVPDIDNSAMMFHKDQDAENLYVSYSSDFSQDYHRYLVNLFSYDNDSFTFKEEVLDESVILDRLKAYYAKGTEDADGDEMTVMEGHVNDGFYETTVRCAVPGNPDATQVLYEVSVDMETAEGTQVRILTDNQEDYFSLF